MSENTPNNGSENATWLNSELQDMWLIGQDKKLLVTIHTDQDRLNAMHIEMLQWHRFSQRGKREIGELIWYFQRRVLRALLTPLLIFQGRKDLLSDNLRWQHPATFSVRYEFGRDGLMRFDDSTGVMVEHSPYGAGPDGSTDRDEQFRFRIGRFVCRPRLSSLGLGLPLVDSIKDDANSSWHISFSQKNRPAYQLGAREPSIRFCPDHIAMPWYATSIEAVFDTVNKCLFRYDVYDDEGHAVMQYIVEHIVEQDH